MIQKIPYKEAVDFLLPRHYSGRIPNIKYAFGYYEAGVLGNLELKAVCTFGKPASNSLCIGICGKEYSSQVYELNRLYSEENINIQLSHFVSACLKELSSENLIIVSYSDSQMNHHGYIYQATNWLYTGATKSRTDKYTENGKHSRHYQNDKQNGLRKVRSSKHRYVYFCGDKRFKKNIINQLKYEILPYPKGENKKYKAGDYIKDVIINKISS